MANAARERGITERIIKALRARGAYVEKIHGDGSQARMLDLVVCYKGYFIALEAKRPGEKLTPYQEYIVNLVKQAGGLAYRVDNVSEAEAVLDEIDYK